MGPAQDCTTRGTGSDTRRSHVEIGFHSPEGKHQQTHCPPTRWVHRESAGRPRAPPLFKAERPPPEPWGSVLSTLPSQGSQAMEEAERPRRGSGNSGPSTTTVMGTPGLR